MTCDSDIPHMAPRPMPSQYLIRSLDRLTLNPADLVAEVHRHWMLLRRREGWVLGPPDAGKKSTPYLKPLERFTQIELHREIGLALNDLRGIKAAILCSCPPILYGESPSRLLRELASDFAFMETAAANIHDGWRRINRKLKMNRGDARLNERFHGLSPGDRAITLSNVRADMEAMAVAMARNAAARL